jgi:uncharacterized protein YbjQ (UPF0145 family)/DNA-binding transcriptional regulator YiaG
MSPNVKSLSLFGACLLFCACASHEFHPNTVIGYLEETSHGRFSNAVKDVANSAKQLGADAVLVESRGKSSEPIGALTNATITPSGGNATVTGATIIAHRHTDRATVVLIKWHGNDRGEIEARQTQLTMSSGRSYYQRSPERYATERQHFQRLISELKRLAQKRGYTQGQIASELGVSLITVKNWWTGHSLTAKRESIERLKKVLPAQ